MKTSSTHFLRASIIVMGLVAALFAIFIVPHIGSDVLDEFPTLANVRYATMAIMYAAVIPFGIILWQGMKLLRFIDMNTAFSQSSIDALRTIKRSAVSIGILYWTLVPVFFYPLAQADDAPGLIIFGALIASVPFVFAVFGSLLQKLLQNAIDLKSENDLTV